MWPFPAKQETVRVSASALSIARDEILRLRQVQASRIASVRARGNAVLGASGVAASLVTVLSDNPWYAFAIAFFAFATVSCVLAMTIRPTEVMHPKGVLASLIDQDDWHATYAIIKQVRSEYDRAEEGLRLVVHHTRFATAWFCCGTIMLLMVSALPQIAAMAGGG